jgi:hypothetical protein
MSFRQRSVILYVSLLAIVSIVVVVLIVKNKKTEFDRIEAAVPGWLGENGCVKIEIKKPSPNASFVKWVGPNATTATIDCEYVSGFLHYARFGSMLALNKALRSRPHWERLCVTGRTVLGDALFDEEEPNKFNIMCHNLHGRRYTH